MRRVLFIGLVLCFIFSLSSFAFAAEKGPSRHKIGLAAIAGAAFPLPMDDYRITESWGFLVDIPLINWFHLAPSAILYRLDEKDGQDFGETDLSMRFRFVVPLPGWKLFFAPFMGMSYGHFGVSDVIKFHAGGSLGFNARIVSNVDFVFVTQYKFIMNGGLHDDNLHMLQPMAGFQFNI